MKTSEKFNKHYNRSELCSGHYLVGFYDNVLTMSLMLMLSCRCASSNTSTSMTTTYEQCPGSLAALERKCIVVDVSKSRQTRSMCQIKLSMKEDLTFGCQAMMITRRAKMEMEPSSISSHISLQKCILT